MTFLPETISFFQTVIQGIGLIFLIAGLANSLYSAMEALFGFTGRAVGRD